MFKAMRTPQRNDEEIAMARRLLGFISVRVFDVRSSFVGVVFDVCSFVLRP